MIIVQLLGGLGNQMFQYALGKKLSILNQSVLKLDTSILLDWRPGKHAVNRDFDLDIFNIVPLFATTKEISPYNPALMTVPQKVKFKIESAMFGKRATTERHFHFDPSMLSLKGRVYLAGTWQSYKYFEGIENQILNDFSFRTPLTQDEQRMLGRIEKANSVCLNVRKTDYISIKNTADIMYNLGPDYYRAALETLKAIIGNFEVFVFSDDIAWCRENLNFIQEKVTYVDHQYSGKKFSSYMQLMVACKHFIIPNSTFAWWAAWLNKNPEKVVIAPNKWFNDATIRTADLIPDKWLRV